MGGAVQERGCPSSRQGGRAHPICAPTSSPISQETALTTTSPVKIDEEAQRDVDDRNVEHDH
jgi:hypothetical protein